MLDWNGRGNSQTVVEHWVQVFHTCFARGEVVPLTRPQIDRLRTGYVAFGQEQLLDVELDRNTPLAPQRDNRISRQPQPTRTTSAPIPIGPAIGES